MTLRFSALVLCSALLFSTQTRAADCPRTYGTDSLGAPFPKSSNWYGSHSLAVILPDDGLWPATAPGAALAVKVVWYSPNLRPSDAKDLTVAVRNVAGNPNTARVSRVTNAQIDGLWTILTGIDFPNSGCWEVSAEYRGQRLSFVVETIDHALFAQRFQ
jgi:hypothetical protein